MQVENGQKKQPAGIIGDCQKKVKSIAVTPASTKTMVVYGSRQVPDLNPTLRYKRVKFPAKRPKVKSETQRQRMGTIMRSFITKGRLIAATVTLILLVAGFLAGAQHGYNLGYLDGENRANGWWIDKKTHYYESSEIRKKRINLKHNHI